MMHGNPNIKNVPNISSTSLMYTYVNPFNGCRDVKQRRQTDVASMLIGLL